MGLPFNPEGLDDLSELLPDLAPAASGGEAQVMIVSPRGIDRRMVPLSQVGAWLQRGWTQTVRPPAVISRYQSTGFFDQSGPILDYNSVAYRFLRQMAASGLYTNIGLKKFTEIGPLPDGRPQYEVTYVGRTGSGGSTTRTERFTQLAGTHPRTGPQFEPVTPEMMQRLTGMEDKPDPRGTVTETVVETRPALRSQSIARIKRLMMDRGVQSKTADELLAVAQNLNISQDVLVGGEGEGNAGLLMGTALAEMWEQGHQERVKRIMEAEGFTDPSLVLAAPVDAPQAAPQGMSDQDFLMSLLNDLTSGGGGGGTRVVRQYQPPDRREVEDMVRGMSSQLLGVPNEAQVQAWTDLYMREDRRAFDQPAIGLSPKASVLEQIRATPTYKTVHKMRPDFVDEGQWIAARFGALIQAGIPEDQAASMAATLAQVGATQEQAFEAGEVTRTQQTGKAQGSLRARLVETARMMGSGVR